MKFSRQVRVRPNLDLTPLLDVVFLLLIFFMVSMRFERIRQVPIDLPKVAAGEAQGQQEQQKVQMRADGSLFIGGKVVQRNDLATRLIEATHLLLSADAEVSHGDFMGLLSELRKLPIESVSVEVDQPSYIPSK
ncbi:MAG: biopolymer transporter ExbD [Myxococcota bacterium]|nr:biopolymer transporter ExbD [Myxococcota bacterium]